MIYSGYICCPDWIDSYLLFETFIGKIRAQLCNLKPLNTIECCVLYGDLKEVLNWSPRTAETRLSLGCCHGSGAQPS